MIEEDLFHARRDLFTSLDFVFFDTTSLYFEGEGGATIGTRGHSKDHRPDLKQMVVGVVLDDGGEPVCSEMWPGNTTDVITLIPELERIRERFAVGQFCIVADRGMISAKVARYLEDARIPYILGARMRKTIEVRQDVLSRAGRYREVYPEGGATDPSPLKVKEVMVAGMRYILCLNEKQARKDAAARQVIVDSLQEKLRTDPKSLVGNKGYRKYLRIHRDSISLDPRKIDEEARYDGKWVLRTTTTLPAEKVALKYKELWQVERVFRDMKSVLDTRPIFHQRDEAIRGHVFCSFLALVLHKELDRRLQNAGHDLSWADVTQDLQSLQEITIEDQGKTLAIRSECQGTCSKIFHAVGVAIPPTIREVT
jgi:transposase